MLVLHECGFGVEAKVDGPVGAGEIFLSKQRHRDQRAEYLAVVGAGS